MTATATPLAPADAPDSAAAVAALCKAAGDPLRLDILRVLSRDSFAVLELGAILDCSQSGMSHHLKVLARAGLVATRREGNTIFYRRAHQPAATVAELCRALFEQVDRLPVAPAVARRIGEVQKERARRSRQFFAEHGDRFRQQQELIAAFEVYGVQAAEVVADCFPAGGDTALEVGPGEGAFLEALSRRFRRVYALDNAEEMLERARATAAAAGLANVEFLSGDTRSPALAAVAADCVVLNMVLHHVSSPAAIFQDLANVLKPGGRLIVTELCRHDQRWVQQACGDLWLGFEPEDLAQWARDAGLTEGRGTYLAQRNGFRVQVRQFTRAG